MNKKLLLLLLLLAGMANAQTVNIPSIAFKMKLLAANVDNTTALDADGASIRIDANNDGQIQVSEAQSVYHLNIMDGFITDLTGISSFVNLTGLDCHNNLLTTLDVSALTNLTQLNCSMNNLTGLNASGLPHLIFLLCDQNELTTLNVNGLSNLIFLSCNNNKLGTLHLNGLTTLRQLFCSNNQLITMNLNTVPQLVVLQIDHNQLTSLNMSNLTNLTHLNCFYNQLSTIDVSNLTNLINLSCGENNITSLNLNGLTQLNMLECSYLPNNFVINGNGLDALTYFNYYGQTSTLTLNGFPALTSFGLNSTKPDITLNLSGFNPNAVFYMLNYLATSLTINGAVGTQLKTVNCSNNQLTSLTLNNLESLTVLNCNVNNLTSLNLANLPDLVDLDVSRNQLTSLDLSNVPNLKRLSCANNRLINLNLSALPLLEYLDCSNHIYAGIIGNQLTSLGVSGLTNLKYLDCSNHSYDGVLGALGNRITSLDVNNLIHLEQLKCNKNNIATLVINNLTNLTHLDCSINLLTSLDLIGLTNLTHLDFSSNQLPNLNMTGLVNITDLTCRNNAITTLNLTNMPNLTRLDCTSNLLTSLNLNGLTQMTHLNFQNNLLTTMDLSTMPELIFLNCNSNHLTNLNLSNLINLNELHCVANQLTSLDVSASTQLSGLFCNGNQLTNLDLLSLTNLNHINCEQNQLTSLNVSTLTNLLSLNFSLNQISNIDLTGLSQLYSIISSNNPISSLDLSNLPNLFSLFCNNNLLTTLDVSNAAPLKYLICNNNPLLETLYMKNGSNETYFDVSDNTALTYICADDMQLASVQNHLNSFGMATTVSNSYCTITPGGPHNTVIGTTIFDGNNNGCNLNDPLHPNIRIDFTDGTITGSAFTNSEGIVTFYADAGNYTITPNIENAAAFNISPASATINFPDNNNNIGNQSFCLSANGVHPDLEIVIVPLDPARPGFDATYELVYKNKGNQVLSGNVLLNFDDSRLDLISAAPVADTQSGDNLTWDYSGLLPFETRVIALVFNVNAPTETPAVNNGDLFNFTTSITPVVGDETPDDNVFIYTQTVVGAFDPNNIICVEGSNVAPSEIGKYLHYVVNFENTGTYAAENVVVGLTINPNEFDIASLQLLNTSHEAYAQVRNNRVEFTFQNIDLQPLAGDPPVGGHGTILFKIKSKTSLQPGDLVKNTANIFFDYNFPIETNDAETTFASLSNPDVTKDKSVVIYPNPTQNIINIDCDNTIKTIELFDIQGRSLRTSIVNENKAALDISDQSNGIYFIRITSDNGQKVEKLIKE